jgi:hypothetical protein
MIELLGTSLGVFIAVTVVVLGFAACMTGIALANTWRPNWQVVPYCLLLGLADRFLTFALFEGELLSLTGYVIDTLVLLAICSTAFRLTLARKMVNQYPWIYERAGPLGWRQKDAK